MASRTSPFSGDLIGTLVPYLNRQSGCGGIILLEAMNAATEESVVSIGSPLPIEMDLVNFDDSI